MVLYSFYQAVRSYLIRCYVVLSYCCRVGAYALHKRTSLGKPLIDCRYSPVHGKRGSNSPRSGVGQTRLACDKSPPTTEEAREKVEVVSGDDILDILYKERL